MRLFTGALVLLLTQMTACGADKRYGSANVGPRSPPVEPSSRTFVYECIDREPFTVRIEGDRAWLFLASGTIGLPHVSSASGAKFSDGDETYWGKGEEAQFVLNGRTYSTCRNNRVRAVWEDAKLRGADFRAVGNEPGWHLEIHYQQMVLFTHNYGQNRHVFPAEPPLIDGAGRTTSYLLENGEHRLVVTLVGRPCSDSMSGESFETTVSLEFDGKRLSGCGRALH